MGPNIELKDNSTKVPITHVEGGANMHFVSDGTGAFELHDIVSGTTADGRAVVQQDSGADTFTYTIDAGNISYVKVEDKAESVISSTARKKADSRRQPPSPRWRTRAQKTR